MGVATDGVPGYAGPPRGRQAAGQVTERNSFHLTAPVVGDVRLPSTDELAFVGGVAVLAAFGLLEWPVAGVLAVGHLLAASTRNKSLRDFGEALEEV